MSQTKLSPKTQCRPSCLYTRVYLLLKVIKASGRVHCSAQRSRAGQSPVGRLHSPRACFHPRHSVHLVRTVNWTEVETTVGLLHCLLYVLFLSFLFFYCLHLTWRSWAALARSFALSKLRVKATPLILKPHIGNAKAKEKKKGGGWVEYYSHGELSAWAPSFLQPW